MIPLQPLALATLVVSCFLATEFRVTHDSVENPIRTGRHQLSGSLQIQFTGRILPHEGSVYELYGGDVESITGRFDQLELPDGWQAELVYSEQPPRVTLRNVRPTRAPAFPGAEGFGKYARGGRGGRVIEVTNLNDAGPGSLRAACEAEGPRIVVFRVAGTIPLASKLKIEHPYLTIAGQSAPGDGTCVANWQVDFETHDLIVRYLRFRPGDVSGREQDGFGGTGDQLVIDHCSVSWSVDECLSINKGSNFSVQWCLVAESLYDSIHHKGKHGYGGLWGGPGGSWHHNLLAHHSSRNPRASGNAESGLMDFRNNVIYNWGFNSAYGGELWPRNWVNNYYRPGPGTRDGVRRRIFIQSDPRGRMYADGNVMVGAPAVTRDNWRGIEYGEGGASESTLRAREPFVVAPVRTQSAEEAYERVLAEVGASRVRDAVDLRIIEEVRTGTARFGASWEGGGRGIIDSQRDVGGWPELRGGEPPADTDHDGMPDAWETARGLDPGDAADGPLDRDGDGYTNVEEYLNSLVP